METIFFKNIPLKEQVSAEFLERMKRNGWVKRVNGKNNLEYQQDYKFYFSLPKGKAAGYLSEVLKSQAICSICGAEDSIHISPKIENDQINFKEVVCVCFECRKEKLNKKDILKPQFKKEVNRDTLFESSRKDISDRFSILDAKLLLSNSQYVKLKMKEANLKTYLKVILPPLSKKDNPNLDKVNRIMEIIMKRHKVESLDQEFNLDKYEDRKKVRNVLYDENRGHCSCCGEKKRFFEFTNDHIVARSKGGKDCIRNLIGLCYDCNNEKDTYRIMDVLRSRRYTKLPQRILEIAYQDIELIKQELHTLNLELIEREEKILLS